jgi:hypothetical protein
VINHASPEFWNSYNKLPREIKKLAQKNYVLFRENPNHPSLKFKKIGNRWSVRVGLNFRALAIETADGLLWTWIGSHDDYDRLIKKK